MLRFVILLGLPLILILLPSLLLLAILEEAKHHTSRRAMLLGIVIGVIIAPIYDCAGHLIISAYGKWVDPYEAPKIVQQSNEM